MHLLSTLLLIAAAVQPTWSETLLHETFDKPGAWQQQVDKTGKIDLIAGGREGNCVRVTSQGHLAYYVYSLDPKRVAGKRLGATCQVKLQDVTVGDLPYETAKIKFFIRAGGQVINRARLFSGTSDWHQETVTADVPENATEVQFQLGLQGGTGTAYYDDLVLDDGLLAVMPVPLGKAANTSLSDGVADDGRGGFLDTGRHDLFVLPQGEVELGGIPFRIQPSGPGGALAIRLKGKDRPDFPEASPAPIEVNLRGKAVVFLQVGGWVDPKRTAPCLVYEVAYEDGAKESIEVVEGQSLGSFDSPADLPGWRVVWSGVNSAGKVVGAGVFLWRNPHPEKKIASITPRSTGKGATPVVIAVSVDRLGQLLSR